MRGTDITGLAGEARGALAELPRRDASSVRSVRRRYSQYLNDASPQAVLRFVRLLLRGAGWPERVVAWEILAAHAGAFALLDDRLAGGMARGLSDWASVDLYGVTVVGPAWRTGLVTDDRILTWAHSSDRWQRRLALVATVPLNLRARGGTGDVRRTLRVCRLLTEDSDDMVVKAMSWALRELAKRDPHPVETFLVKHEDRLAPRIRREVLNKIRLGLKSPRRPDGRADRRGRDAFDGAR